MGKASVSIAITSSFDATGIQKAQDKMQKLAATAVSARGTIGKTFTDSGTYVSELGSKIGASGKKIEAFGKGVSAVGDTLTKCFTVPTIALGTAASSAAIAIDTAFYDVQKTVDMTDEEFQQLKDNAIEFSKTQPVSAETILQIESLGGQLGIANDELEDFAQTVAGLEIATNLEADEAATELARFKNIVNDSDFDTQKFASTLVDLGNNSATTESEIMNMAMRFASAGSQAGMTSADILGISASLSSLGMRSEAGGSALSKVINQINSDVASSSDGMADWAELCGVSVDEFKSKWQSDAAGTFTEILAGIGNSSEAMQVKLDELGISEIRTSDAMRRLAGNSDLVKSSVELANQAWEENTALTNEVEKRNESLQSRIDTLKNRLIAVGDEIGGPFVERLIEMGDKFLESAENLSGPLGDALQNFLDGITPVIEFIGNLIEAYANLDDGTQKMISGFVGTAAALGPVISVGGKVIQTFGQFKQGVGNVVSVIGSMSTNWGIYREALDTTNDAMIKELANTDNLTAKKGLEKNAMIQAAGGLEAYIEKSNDVVFVEKERQEREQIMQTLLDKRAQIEEKTAAGIEKANERIRTAKENESLVIEKCTEKIEAASKRVQTAQDKEAETIERANDRVQAASEKVLDAKSHEAEVYEAQNQRIIDAAGKVADAEQNYLDVSKDHATYLDQLEFAQSEYNDALEDMRVKLDAAKSGVIDKRTADEQAAAATARFEEKTRLLATAEDAVKKSENEVAKAAKEVEKAQESKQKVVENASKKIEAAHELVEKAQEHEKQVIENSNESIQKAMDATATAKEKEAAEIEKASARIEAASKKVESAEGNLADVVEDGTKALEANADEMANIKTKSEKAADAATNAAKKAEKVNDAIDDMQAGLKDTASSTTLFQKAITKGKGALSTFGTVVSNVGKSLAGAFMASLPTLAITALTTAVTYLVTKFSEAKERAENFKTATEGLSNPTLSAAAAVDEEASSFQNFGDILQETKDATNDMIDTNLELLDSYKDAVSELDTSNQVIDDAYETILKYNGQTDLTAQQLGEFQSAIDSVNGYLGTQYKLLEGNKVGYEDESGAIQLNTADLKANIEQRKKLVATDAIKNLYEDAKTTLVGYQQQVGETQAKIANLNSEYEKANKLLEDYRNGTMYTQEEVENARAVYNGYTTEHEALTEELEKQTALMNSEQELVDGLAWSYGTLADEATGLKAEYADLIAENQGVFQALGGSAEQAELLSDSLSETGISVDNFKSLGTTAMSQVAASFDGTTGSVIESLRGLGSEGAKLIENAGLSWTYGMDASTINMVESAAKAKGKTLAQFEDYAKEMGHTGQDGIVAFAKSIEAEEDAVAQAAAGAVDGAVDSASSEAEKQDVGALLMQSTATGIDNNSYLVQASMTSAKDAAVAAFSPLMTDTGVIVSNTMTGAANTATNNSGIVQASFTTAKDQAVSAFSPIISETEGIVSASVTGAANTVSTNSYQVTDAYGAIVNGSQTVLNSLSGFGITAGTNSATNIGTSVNSNQGFVTSAFQNLVSVGSTIIGGLTSIFSKTGTTSTNVLGTAIKSGTSTVSKNTSNLSNTVVKQLSTLTTKVKSEGAKASSGYASGISSSASKATASMSTMATTMKTSLNNFSASAGTISAAAMTKFTSGISSASGRAYSVSANVANRAKAGLNQHSSSAYTWGQHLGTNFASGISSKSGAVSSAASKLASAAASYLEHTTPETGPLADDDVWGTHLAQNISAGMEKGIPNIEKSALAVAQAASKAGDYGRMISAATKSYASTSQARTTNNTTYNLYVNGELLKNSGSAVNEAIGTLAAAITQQANMRR